MHAVELRDGARADFVADATLRARLRAVASKHPRWGYRFAHAMLARDGVRVNHKRVWRLWRAEQLALPPRRKRRRFARSKPHALHHGAPNVVQARDFVHDRCVDGRVFRCLTVIDEGTREALATFPA